MIATLAQIYFKQQKYTDNIRKLYICLEEKRRLDPTPTGTGN
jgi:hypothetical protein